MKTYDSQYLQRMIRLTAEDMLENDDKATSEMIVYIADRLNQSYPDGDVDRETIEQIMREPGYRDIDPDADAPAGLLDWLLDID